MPITVPLALLWYSRRMNWRKVIQLTLVHVGVSITAVPISDTLNRVMISDMQLSAFLVGVLLAIPALLSPLQLIIGNWADRNPLWGRHRSPWILIGGLMASFGGYFTAHAAYLMNEQFVPGLLLALLTFTTWGLGVNMASVSYLSLVSELSGDNEGWRSRAVGVMWTTMISSIIVVSIATSRMLDPFSQEALYTAFGVVWLVSSLLVVVGSARLETPADRKTVRQNRADNPIQAFKLLAGNPEAQRFFVYLTVVLISIHAQDVVLEPYGADVLGMSVAATSRLKSIWGVGVLVMLLVGIWIIRRIGKKPSANIGAAIAAVAFLLIVVAGLVQQISLFMAAILLLGLGSGLMTVSNLSLMLDMTIPQAAGLYMGVWGVANFAGQALGNILSGLTRDIAFQLTQNVTIGYMVVLGLEIVGLVTAILLFRTISVSTFRESAETRLHEAMALAGDL